MGVRKEATFVVHVVKSQDNAWSGQISWIDSDEKLNFRSAMELINIMDSAVDTAKERQ